MPFALAPGLAYVNAVEDVASAMEMSAIAGVNAALLVQRHLASVSPAQHSTRREHLDL